MRLIEAALRSISFAILRLAGFASNAFLFGFPLFLLLVFRPALAGLTADERSKLSRTAGRRAEELVRAALIASILSVFLTIILQATLVAELEHAPLGGATLSSVLGSNFGTWLAIRLPLLSGLAILLVGRVGLAVGDRAGKVWWSLWLSLAGAVLLATSEGGHAGVVAYPGSLVNDVIHLGSGAVWFAGIASLSLLLPISGAGADSTAIARAVRRFSNVAFVSITLAAVTGTLNSYLEVGHIRDMWGTGYGRSLTLKICLFLGILSVGGFNHFVMRRRLEIAEARGPGPDADRALFRKTISLEVGIAVALLAMTAILTGLAPTNGGG